MTDRGRGPTPHDNGRRLLAEEYVRLPPGRRHVWIPLADRRTTASAVLLYSPTHTRGMVGQSAAYWTARVAGGRALPLRRQRWSPRLPSGLWAALIEQWQAVVGPIDVVAVYEQPQTSRHGLGLLMLKRGVGAVSFVKLRPGADSVRAEQLVLDGIARTPDAPVSVPAVLAAGEVDDWGWLALAPLPGRLRRPRWDLDVPALVATLQPAMARALTHPRGTPDSWTPMHGDLTPWNVRRDRRGRTWVYDWEDAGWGPPMADDVYYRAARAVLHRGDAGTACPEAVDHWMAVVARRPSGDDARFNRALLSVLRAMRRQG